MNNLDNCSKPRDFQGHGSKVKAIFSLVDQSSPNCLHWTWENLSW